MELYSIVCNNAVFVNRDNSCYLSLNIEVVTYVWLILKCVLQWDRRVWISDTLL
jgi:hypothetical protein